MVASDGPHYGDNVKLAGPGKYHVKLTVYPPNAKENAMGMHYGRHTDRATGVRPWFKAFEVEYEFTYVGIGKKGGYGNYVQIRHNGTYSSGYAHAQSFAKGLKVGSRVNQGETIAYVGATGQATGVSPSEVHRQGEHEEDGQARAGGCRQARAGGG